jgi:hypothetical protein
MLTISNAASSLASYENKPAKTNSAGNHAAEPTEAGLEQKSATLSPATDASIATTLGSASSPPLTYRASGLLKSDGTNRTSLPSTQSTADQSNFSTLVTESNLSGVYNRSGFIQGSTSVSSLNELV